MAVYENRLKPFCTPHVLKLEAVTLHADNKQTLKEIEAKFPLKSQYILFMSYPVFENEIGKLTVIGLSTVGIIIQPCVIIPFDKKQPITYTGGTT